MALRDALNKNQPVVLGVVIVAIIAAGIVIYRQFAGGGTGKVSQVFYTVDDGKTWFADDVGKIPPFQVDGKEAVHAFVASCNGKMFVMFMQKYSDEGKKLIDDLSKKASSSSEQNDAIRGVQNNMRFRLCKRPGDKDWIPMSEIYKLDTIGKCPDGSELTSVTP